MKKAKKLRIKVSFFAILMLVALTIGHSYISFAAIIAATLHELGHITVARMLNSKLSVLKLGIFGASLSTNVEMTSYKNEILIAIAGPLINLVCVAFMLPCASRLGDFGQMFLAASIFLGALNLLPISDLDGGRVLFCLIAMRGSFSCARNVLRVSSFVLIFTLWSLSVYLILRLGASLSLFVFSASLFCKIFIDKDSKI